MRDDLSLFNQEFGMLDTSDTILSDATAFRQQSKQEALMGNTKMELVNELGNFLRAFSTNSEMISAEEAALPAQPEAAPVTAPVEAPAETAQVEIKELTKPEIKELPPNTTPAELDSSLNRNSLINQLEDQFYYLNYEPIKITEPQLKYIRSYKKILHQAFKNYENLLTYCMDYMNNGEMLDEQVFLFIHSIYTLSHPEKYIELFSFDVFSEATAHGGIFYFVDSFRKSVKNLVNES